MDLGEYVPTQFALVTLKENFILFYPSAFVKGRAQLPSPFSLTVSFQKNDQNKEKVSFYYHCILVRVKDRQVLGT